MFLFLLSVNFKSGTQKPPLTNIIGKSVFISQKQEVYTQGQPLAKMAMTQIMVHMPFYRELGEF